jgi:hypothetical protein
MNQEKVYLTKIKERFKANKDNIQPKKVYFYDQLSSEDSNLFSKIEKVKIFGDVEKVIHNELSIMNYFKLTDMQIDYNCEIAYLLQYKKNTIYKYSLMENKIIKSTKINFIEFLLILIVRTQRPRRRSDTNKTNRTQTNSNLSIFLRLFNNLLELEVKRHSEEDRISNRFPATSTPFPGLQ